MTRRRKTTKEIEHPHRLFSSHEDDAIKRALSILWKRKLFHLIAPKYDMLGVNLADYYRTLTHPAMWDTMQLARDNMLKPRNDYAFEAGFYDSVDIGDGFNLYVTTEQFIPKARTPDVDDMWNRLIHYAREARAARTEFVAIWKLYSEMDADGATDIRLKRSTVAHAWPCIAALFKLAGAQGTSEAMASVTRPAGTIPDKYVVRVRDTNSFIMQHMLLPAIDAVHQMVYHGDEETGPAVNLNIADAETLSGLGSVIWPLKE